MGTAHRPGIGGRCPPYQILKIGHVMPPSDSSTDDARLLRRLGYAQELDRRLGGFSNFALSFSIICILSGGVTSFHLGVCAVGGAAIGLGWPLMALFALAVAATMAQVASAFPTAGGLYHWASILGGRGWGWVTAWFNLAGLVTVVAAVNVGMWAFAVGFVGPLAGLDAATVAWLESPLPQVAAVGLITATQAWLNDRGIRLTTRLTDLSGYLILAVAAVLTAAMIAFAPTLDPARLVTFTNFSGTAGGRRLAADARTRPALRARPAPAGVHPHGLRRLRARRRGNRECLASRPAGDRPLGGRLGARRLGDACRGGGGRARPPCARGGGGSRLPLGLAGRLARPRGSSARRGNRRGDVRLRPRHGHVGLADGLRLRARRRPAVLERGPARSPPPPVPAIAVWSVAVASWLFTVWTPIYATITAVCTIFLYLSYVLPTALGALAYGRTWTRMGPWDLGRWYRPLAAVTVLGCAA